MNLRMQGLLVILGSVLIGLAAGVVVERTRFQAQPGRRFPAGEFREDSNRRRSGSQRLPPGFDRLGLTEVQQHRVDSVFQYWQPHTEAVMDSFIPRLRALRDSAMADVESILTPTQRERLRTMEPFGGREAFPRRRQSDRQR
jgi:hypothetical protein